jgi:phospholipid/cholesterol/gamma-HCH transport system substrate-binding protein
MAAKTKILAGVFVIGGFLLFGAGLFLIGDRRLMFSESIELAAEFANAGNLKVGAKVLVSGMDAGEVLAIEVPSRPSGRFTVRFRVLERFRQMLRKDSVAVIQVEGLVGSKVLQVGAGSESAPPVMPGMVIQSREPMEIADLVESAADTIGKVSFVVEDVQERVGKAIDTITDVGEQARLLTIQVRGDSSEILGTGKRIAASVDTMVDGVRQGRGTVGKLLTDEEIYGKLRATVDSVAATAANAQAASDDVKRIVADLKARDLGGKVEATTANLQQTTAHVKDVVATLRPSPEEGERGLIDDLRDTLANAREATSDLAEDMEALKRNWFFRGFFRRRGFYDLDALSQKEYLEGRIARGRAPERQWLSSGELFVTGPNGDETLSDAGKKRLAAAIAPYLRLSPNTLLMVEGYAGQGTEEERLLKSRDRARYVRRYLVDRFALKPNYTGAMPMGGVKSSAPSGDPWDGIAIVYFREKN